MTIGGSSPTPDGKIALRRRMAALRDALADADRAAWSAQACAHAAAWLAARGAGAVMLYAPFRSELDTRPLMQWAWEQGVAVVLPVCRPDDRTMRLYFVEGTDQLRSGAYGIPEPDPRLAAACPEPYAPDALFVPGLAYDRQGGRLGYGGGYYDRFREHLERLSAATGRPVPPWLGIGYGVQVTDAVPMEPHDARLDGLVTERGAELVARAAAK